MIHPISALLASVAAFDAAGSVSFEPVGRLSYTRLRKLLVSAGCADAVAHLESHVDPVRVLYTAARAVDLIDSHQLLAAEQIYAPFWRSAGFKPAPARRPRRRHRRGR